MLRRELAIRWKGFAIWAAILFVLFAGIILGYPYLIDEELYGMLDSFMAVLPKGLLSSFNMDIVSISKASGWLQTEGIVFLTLLGAIYAALQGGNAILCEQSDKTIEFLCSLPVSRARIVLSHFAGGFLYVLLLPCVIAAGTCGILVFTEDMPFPEMLPLLLSPGLVFAGVYAIVFALSTLFRRAGVMTGIGMAFVLGSYLLSVLGQLSVNAAPLKKLSVFSLCDTRALLLGGSVTAASYAACAAIIVMSFLFSLLVYDRKALV